MRVPSVSIAAFFCRQLALEHHHAQGVAGHFPVQPLTVAAVEHAKQRLQANAQVGFAAAKHAEGGVRVHIDNAIKGNVQRVGVTVALVRKLLHQTC